MSLKATITVGISGSGKTTWANEVVAKDPSYYNLNRDDIRLDLIDRDGVRGIGDNMWRFWKWKREGEVDAEWNKRLEWAYFNGHNLIVSDTNLNKDRANALATRLRELGYEVDFKHFEVSYEDAVKRDKNRRHSVGHEVIYDQLTRKNASWGRARSPKFVEGNNKAILVDIDGTLAHMKGRSPYEWDKVDQDIVDPHVRDIVNMYKDKGYTVIVLSGRDRVCRDLTIKWLQDNDVKFDFLFMRALDDQRKDYVVKEELYFDNVDGAYNVEAVFDDRPQVVRLWLELGFKVFAVGNPYLEF